jgi:hypothetical protein
MKYDEIKDGEWVTPAKKGYKLACCDCGLVHRMDFKHVEQGKSWAVMFRAFRDNRATAAIRRSMKGLRVLLS